MDIVERWYNFSYALENFSFHAVPPYDSSSLSLTIYDYSSEQKKPLAYHEKTSFAFFQWNDTIQFHTAKEIDPLGALTEKRER